MIESGALNFEAGTRPRLAKSVGASVTVHVLLCLWFVLVGQSSQEAEGLTEISWMEPSPPEKLAVAEPREIPAAVSPPRPPEPEPVPRPETALPARFDLDGRVADLTPDPVRKREPVLDTASPSAVPRSAAPLPQAGPAQAPTELVRRENEPRPALELKRSPASPPRAGLTLPDVPAPALDPVPAKDAESAPERSLAGASLVGPVAERRLDTYVKPDYPEWAKREGVEASVTIYFLVLPDGRVKKNLQLQKTSGFEDFDRKATQALLAWRFGPLPAGVSGDQWGIVTFHYRLTDPATGP